MRHRKRTIKLGRTSSHREAMLANMVSSLIESKRIQTTLPKARAARSLVEKMITLGKQGTLSARRRAISTLRNEDAVRELFSKVAPAFNDRKGGYTRIFKLGRRSSDSSEMALLEFVDYILPVKADPDAKDTKPAKKAAPRKKAAAAADKAE